MNWLFSSTQLKKQKIDSPPKPSHPVPQAVTRPTEDNHCPKTDRFGTVISGFAVSSLSCPPHSLNIRFRQPPGGLESQLAFCCMLFRCGNMPLFVYPADCWCTASGQFPVGTAARTSATDISISVHVFWRTYLLTHLLDRVEVLGHRVWLCLVLVDTTAKQFFKVLLSSETPQQCIIRALGCSCLSQPLAF